MKFELKITKQLFNLDIDLDSNQIIGQTEISFIYREIKSQGQELKEIKLLHMSSTRTEDDNPTNLNEEKQEIEDNQINEELPKIPSVEETNPNTVEFTLNAVQMEILSVKQNHQILSQEYVTLQSYYYMPAEKQTQLLGQVLQFPASINMYEQYYQKYYEPSQGLLLKFAVKDQFYTENIMEYKFDIQICYKITQPVAGLKIVSTKKFQLNENKNFIFAKFCFTEYFIGSSSCWLPSQDTEINFERVAITIKSDPITYNKKSIDYTVLCSGNLQEEILDEDHKKRQFIYSIKKAIKPDFIGIAVGQFQIQPIEHLKENYDCQSYLCYGPFQEVNSQQQLLKQLKLLEIFNYLNSFYSKKKDKIFDDYKIVFLPNISYDYLENEFPNSFYQLTLIDDSYLYPLEKLLTPDIEIQQSKCFLKHINFSIMQQQIKLKNTYHNDYWILIGINEWICDYFQWKVLDNNNQYNIYIFKLFELLQDYIHKGMEISPLQTITATQPLNNFSEAFGYEKFYDKVFQLKARLCIHLLSTKLRKQELPKLIVNSLNDSQWNTRSMMEFIRNTTGVKELKYFRKQILHGTGMPFIKLTYQSQRQENQIELQINQDPVQYDIYKLYNITRLKLEQKYKSVNQEFKSALEYFNKNKFDKSHFQQQYQVNQKQGEQQQQQSTSSNGNKIEEGQQAALQKLPILQAQSSIQLTPNDLTNTQSKSQHQSTGKQQEDKELHKMFDHVLFIPSILKSIRLFFYNKVQVIGVESNENEQKDGQDDINITSKASQSQKINIRRNFRRNATRKTNFEEERKEKASKKSKEENSGMWLTLDPQKEFILDFSFTNCTETQLLRQLKQDKSIFTFMHAVKQLYKLKLSNDNIIQFQEFLFHWGDKLELYKQIECLQLIIHQLSQQDPVQLQSKIKAISLLRVNSFEEKTNILKPNFFLFSNSKQTPFATNLYLINLCLINSMHKIKDEIHLGKAVQSQMNIETLIQMLDYNDNSINLYDDTQYVASLLGSLLQTQNPKFGNSILKRVEFHLRKELLFPSYKFLIYATILKYLCTFLKTNHISIKKASEQSESQFFQEIKQKIKRINSQYDSLIIQVAYFHYKIDKKRILRGCKHSVVMLYVLKKLDFIRLQPGSQQKYLCLLKEWYEYIVQNQHIFLHDMQLESSTETNFQIADFIWEQLTTGISLIHPKIRLYWVKIYRVLYFHWAPLCALVKRQVPQSTVFNNFAFDEEWMQTLHQGGKQDAKGQMNFKYLNLPKKKKKKRHDGSNYNIQEELVSFCLKHQYNIDWIVLAKHILSVLEKQKQTQNSENQANKQQEGNEKDPNNPTSNNNNNQNNIVNGIDANSNNPDDDPNKIKLSVVLTFKTIKKYLKGKNFYKDLSQVKLDTLSVVTNYIKQGVLNEEEAQEFYQLIETYFSEAEIIWNKILKSDQHQQMTQKQQKQKKQEEQEEIQESNKIQLGQLIRQKSLQNLQSYMN